MADTVVAKTLRNSDTQAAFLFGCQSDGTGESAVQKVDISALAMAASKVKITKLRWSCNNMTVAIAFDHTTDDTVAILTGQGHIDQRKQAPLLDPGSSGGTGDILFTTKVPATSTGNGYTVYMEIEKVS